MGKFGIILSFLAEALFALRGLCVLRWGQDVPSFPHAPFLACGAVPSLRSGQFFLTKPNTSCTIEMPASLRSEGVQVHPGMPLASLRNQRSASPESSDKARTTLSRHLFDEINDRLFGGTVAPRRKSTGARVTSRGWSCHHRLNVADRTL